MQKYRICLVGGGLRGGGQERALTNLANFAAEKGYEVFILNLFKTEVFFDLHPSIRLVWPTLKRETMHRLVYAMRLLPFIRKSIQQIKPDTILSFGEWFNPYVLLATKGLAVPVYVTDRMGPDLYLGKLIETARRFTYPFAYGIIAQTNIAAHKIHSKTGAKNICVIPNAVREITIVPQKRKKQVVTVGRLSREKGHQYLLQAFAQIPYSDWLLHIVGDGVERTKLESLTKELGIQERVYFHGYLKDFSKILAESEIFILPSLYEGFPNALLEAMSVPLACISSDCVAGPADIIEHGQNGLLVQPQNIEELTKAILLLIEDEQKRSSIAIQAAKVREKYKFSTVAERYLQFILPEQTK